MFEEHLLSLERSKFQFLGSLCYWLSLNVSRPPSIFDFIEVPTFNEFLPIQKKKKKKKKVGRNCIISRLLIFQGAFWNIL